ncbi:MAG: hypothetical protein IKK70_00505 [Clostridia bacterium]|nr:hypothetical protein [Clostridia bacterium]
MKKSIILLLALTLSLLAVGGVAAEQLELNKKGSISASFACAHGFKSYGKTTLYHVADAVEDENGYKLVLTTDFKGSGLSLDDVENPKTASTFERFARSRGLSGDTRDLENGSVTYDGLSAGLYLIVHKDDDERITEALPFFVSLPRTEDGKYVYDVNAAPKVLVKHAEGELPPSIPQTGQLKWPIPVLAFSGIIVFTVGWVLCFKARRDGE